MDKTQMNDKQRAMIEEYNKQIIDKYVKSFERR